MAHKVRTWVLVADGNNARIYANEGPGEGLNEILREQTPARQTHEIVSDRHGRDRDSQGAGRHAMDSGSDPQRHEKEEFARALCDLLDRYAADGAFDRIVLTAAPRTLGDLRAMLSPRVRERVVAELDKDLVHEPARDLVRHLADIVRL